jgi:hypothetical protein
MAIDYIIDYNCPPKEELGTRNIIERMKGQERANTIIRLFREKGDERPPSEMGFEFTRSTPSGEEETRLVVVQDLLDDAEDLKPLQHHCTDCPANHTQRPFGCMNFIQYPLSKVAETWMLDRLPVPDDALIFLLFRRGIEEFEYDGSSVLPLRNSGEIYFEGFATTRRLGEFTVDANQVFEMLFAVGNIIPNHSALLLLFLNAISRDMEADQIMHIAPSTPEITGKYPFLLQITGEDDKTVAEIKDFLKALYIAWSLNIKVILDV